MPLTVLLFLLLLAGNWLFSEVTVAFPLEMVHLLWQGMGWVTLGVVLLFVFWCFGD